MENNMNLRHIAEFASAQTLAQRVLAAHRWDV